MASSWEAPWLVLRQNNEKNDDTDPRSIFEQDRDRIIHSSAFRILQGKTQVFTAAWAPQRYSRVTHSIQVSHIGRGIVKRLNRETRIPSDEKILPVDKIPEALVEAACLAHDIGHPPFGHEGETALNECMEGKNGFEGNAQTLRAIVQLEKRVKDQEGLNLCRATLLSLVKYPWVYDGLEEKWNFSPDDIDKYGSWLYHDSSFRRDLKPGKNHELEKTLPCQIMDWADDIAYATHDLEDDFESRFLNVDFLGSKVRFLKLYKDPIFEQLKRKRPKIRKKDIQPHLDDFISRYKECGPLRMNQTLRQVSSDYIHSFITSTKLKKNDGNTPMLWSIEIDPKIRLECDVLKAIHHVAAIEEVRTARFASKTHNIVKNLFDVLYNKEKNKENLLFQRRWRNELKNASDKDRARYVCDYIWGLTELEALNLYQTLFEASAGSPFL